MSDATLSLFVATQAVPSPGLVATVWDMVIKGGWTMIPLGLVSLVAMTIIVERLIVTRKARVAPPELVSSLASMRGSPRQALAKCRAESAPAAAVLGAAIQWRDESREVQEKQIADAGEREVRKLRQRMRLLSVLPQAATMLGLLGTVFGMIRTFTVVAASGESLGKTEKLAQGIYEAWTATAGGLVVAIPTLVMYHIIMARIDAAAALLDTEAVRWLEARPQGETAEAGVTAGATAGAAAEPGLAMAQG